MVNIMEITETTHDSYMSEKLLEEIKTHPVVVKGLTKVYNQQVVALSDLTVSFPKGAVGLLGPNGSGKSTLIKILLKLVTPTNGDAWVLGKNIKYKHLEIHRDVGYVPENDCLPLKLNAVEVCKLFGIASGLSPSDALQRAHEVLDYVGIDESRYREINSYSTGMKQRVKLAQALIHDPPLLLIDEPTNGLDPSGREEMIKLLNELKRVGKNLIISSHILPDIEETCDNVVIIHNGQLVIADSLEDVLRGAMTRLLISTENNQHFVKLLQERNIKILSWDTESIIIDSSGLDINQLFKIAADNDIGIRKVFRPKKSLEEFFLAALNINLSED